MIKSFSFFLLVIVLVSGCAQDKPDYIVKINTDYGEMVAILYDETPKHKENFIKLAKEHFYDSLLFHRVMQGFMIQGGDPESKKAQPGQNLGAGGPGYTVPAEFNPKFFHERGALSAARLGDQQNPKKASSGSQFYIVQGTVAKAEDLESLKINQNNLMAGLQQMLQNPANQPLFDSLNQLYGSGDMQAYQKLLFSQAGRVERATGLKVSKDISPESIAAYTSKGGSPFLDGEYTVFGMVIKGLDVIDKIAVVQTDELTNRPQQDVRMTVTVTEMSRNQITKEYGYKFPESR